MSASTSKCNKRIRLNNYDDLENNQTNSLRVVTIEDDDDDDDDIEIREQLAEQVEFLAWQRAQIESCISDNEINRILESYFTIFEYFDVNNVDRNNTINELNFPTIPPIMQNTPSDHNNINNNINSNNRNSNRLEESAILMAISEHGLQQTDSENFSSINQQPSTSTGSILPSSSNIPKDNLVPQLETAFSLTPTSSADTIFINRTNNETEHADFMEAAVAAAIQKKGLTPYSISTSPTR